jgi:lipoyl(octanoyl) transferase
MNDVAYRPSHQPSFTWLGRMEYGAALAMQDAAVAQRLRSKTQDTVLLLEHEPVYTIGRTKDRTSLRDPATLPHPVVEIGRGGQATYHGPGQLVGYPIIDLKNYIQDLHLYLRSLEESIIRYCQELGINAGRRDGLTGVWVGERKLASIGVGVRQWVTLHGFGLNVCGSLAGFAAITPCGIDGVSMTSMELEGATGLTVEAAAQGIQPHLIEALSHMSEG